MKRPRNTTRRTNSLGGAFLALLCLLPGVAFAQSSVLQGGAWAQGHVPQYAITGSSSQTVVQDGGSAGGGAVGVNPSEIGITARGTGTAPYVGQGSGYLGANFCLYDAPTTNAAGGHQLCLSPNATGAFGMLSYNAFGGAAQQDLKFIINGQPFTFPFSGGSVIGPSLSAIGNMACWNNVSGTLLSDCGAPILGPSASVIGNAVVWNGVTGKLLKDAGFPPAVVVANLAALKAFSITGVAAGYPITRNGYTTAGDGGAADYILSLTNCSAADNGAQVQPTAGTGCWIASFPATGVSPLVFGADATGAGDSSTAFQAASTYLCSLSQPGGTISVPRGIYTVHGVTMACPIYVRGVGRTSTYLRYTGSSTFGLRWQVPNFPAFASFAHILGSGISDMTLNYATGTTSILQFQGVRDATIERITMQNCISVCDTPGSNLGLGQFTNGVDLFGVAFARIEDVALYGVNGSAIIIRGDLSGQKLDGTSCAVDSADCSTRTDFVSMRHIVALNGNGSASIGVDIRGFVATLMGEHIGFENFGYGMKIVCAPGFDPNMSQCPHFITLDDFQTEFFKLYGIYASDFIDMKLKRPYLYGDASSSNVHNLFMGSVNYAASTTPVGKVKVDGAVIFSDYLGCIRTTGILSTVEITNSWINGCNAGNGGSAGVSIESTTSPLKIQGNTFCTVDGYAGAFPIVGLVVGANATKVQINNNSFYGCSTAVSNFSGSPYSVSAIGNVGPGAGPTISACGTATVVGTDNAMLIEVTAGTPGTCTVNFGSTQMRSPICTLAPAPGAIFSAAYSVSVSATQVVITQAGMAGQYNVLCQGS